MYGRRTKYGNRWTTYGGRNYQSQKEADHARILDISRRAHDLNQRVVSVIAQYKIPLHAQGGILVGNYIADFHVTYADGSEQVHEVKGFRTQLYEWKKKHVEAEYNIKIIEF